jgi:DNA repair photolyase
MSTSPPSGLPAGPRKGRGAGLNPAGRFEALRREAFDDGWSGLDELAADPPPATEVLPDRARTVIARNESPDIPFDQSINPYRGCEHGCVYCYARPSHAHLGLSPGLDFETRLFAKHDAAELLRKELSRPSYVCRPISLGANTDPYQPIERRLEITRRIVEVLAETRHPFSIVTKSALVLRDLDLLAPMAAEGLVRVFVSITTLDAELARRMEPRAAAPHRRLATLGGLREAGVPAGVMVAPIIPALNDSEIEAILERAALAGAESAGWVLLRLPHELKDLVSDWLERHYPLRARRVLALVRETRGGALNDPAFGSRMRGRGAYAELIARRFALACRRLGLDRQRMAGRTDLFRPPRTDGQLDLFA